MTHHCSLATVFSVVAAAVDEVVAAVVDKGIAELSDREVHRDQCVGLRYGVSCRHTSSECAGEPHDDGTGSQCSTMTHKICEKIKRSVRIFSKFKEISQH